jgi:HPt (histidine-containing phosphotransfer) domain-containing protein
MRELIVIFEEDFGQMLDEVRKAGEAGDAKALHRAAHGLKGMVGNYCADRVMERAAEVDARARSGQLEGVGELIAALSDEVDSLEEALREFRMSLENGNRPG